VQSARVDPELSIRVRSSRELRYSSDARLEDDRPVHVRAASGLAFFPGRPAQPGDVHSGGGRLAVVQDDCAFIGMVAGKEVAALTLPRGAGGRRRFEVGLGNKHEKYDLEACVAVGDDLFAFGSGSTSMREKIVHIGYATHVLDAAPLYARLREEVGGLVNIEGVALVHGEHQSAKRISAEQLTPTDAAYSGAMELWPGTAADASGNELWLFHRGNTGPQDAGPTIVKFARSPLLRWLLGNGPVPDPLGSVRFDLGSVDGVRLGFTDAVAVDERVFYLAAAEDSPNAIDDGRVLASHLGVIQAGVVRAAPLLVGGMPVKAEGLAFQADIPGRAWVAIDPDDVDQAAKLLELELVGPW
jgi:hypothetical protein